VRRQRAPSGLGRAAHGDVRKGRVDYILRARVTLGTQPVAVAPIEAKAENLSPSITAMSRPGFAPPAGA